MVIFSKSKSNLSEQDGVYGHRGSHYDGRKAAHNYVGPLWSVGLDDPQRADFGQVFVGFILSLDRILPGQRSLSQALAILLRVHPGESQCRADDLARLLHLDRERVFRHDATHGDLALELGLGPFSRQLAFASRKHGILSVVQGYH